MMEDRKMFWDEDVLRIQNEVRRYKREQRIHDGDVNDKMQYGLDTDSDSLSGQSRDNILQNSSSDTQR